MSDAPPAGSVDPTPGPPVDPSPGPPRRPLRDTLRSRRFIERALLLTLTAVLTGIVVPIIDDRRAREQRVFEADIARQQKVIDAQSELLVSMEALYSEWMLDVLKIIFYRTDPVNADPDRFEAMTAEYETNGWDFFGAAHRQQRLMERLAPPVAVRAMQRARFEVSERDSEILALVRQDAPDSAWLAFEDSFVVTRRNIEAALDTLAMGFGLTFYRGARRSMSDPADSIQQPLTSGSSVQSPQSEAQ